MRKFLFVSIALLSFFRFSYAGILPPAFYPQQGQYTDRAGNAAPILAVCEFPGMRFQLHREGYIITYYTTKGLPEKYQYSKSQESLFPSWEIVTEQVEVKFENGKAESWYFTGAGDFALNYDITGFTENQNTISAWSGLVFKNVWPGIDAHFSINERSELKYNLELQPGADPAQIGWKILGNQTGIKVTQESFRLFSKMGTFSEILGPVYQENGEIIQASFSGTDNLIRLNIETYDPTQKLIVDPGLVWSTYYGSPDIEVLTDLKTLSDGSVVACGFTSGVLFPVQNAFQDTFRGNLDGLILKMDANGQRLWATYFGGSGYDKIHDLDLTSAGDIVICGETSADIPVSTAAFQMQNAGGTDAFIASFNPNGLRNWSTHFGGALDDYGYGVTFDQQNRMYLCGASYSGDLPVSNGFQPIKAGSAVTSDAYLVQLTLSGAPGWGTFMGGNQDEYAYSVCLDPFNRLQVCGSTSSTNYPVLNAYQLALAGGTDIFLFQMNVMGQLLWSTFLGGVDNESGTKIQSDAAGALVINGYSDGPNYPVLNPYQGVSGGGVDMLIAKLNGNGIPVWSGYFGGVNNEYSTALAIDTAGRILSGGYTHGAGFPASYGYQNTSAGSDDGVLVHLNPNGALLWSSYFGGSKEDYIYGVDFSGASDIILGGLSSSLDLPVLNAFQDTNATTTPFSPTQDIFLTRLCQSQSVISGTQTICTGSVSLPVQFSGSGPWDIIYTDGQTQVTITGINQNPYQLQVTPSATRTYTLVQVSDTQGCGFGRVRGQAVVSLIPSVPQVQIQGIDSICPGSFANLNFTLSGTGPWNIIYTDGNSNFIQNGITTPAYAVPVQPSVSTTYTMVSCQSACGAGNVSGTAIVYVDANAVPSALISGTYTVCPGQPASVPVQLNGAQPWNLSWSDGIQNISQTGISASPFIIQVPGIAGIMAGLIQVDNVCGTGTVSGSALIDTFALPVAGFTFTTDTLEVQFNNTSSHSTQVFWSFGDSFTDTLMNPVYTYLNAGTYLVRQVAINACGTDTAEQVVSVSIPPQDTTGIMDLWAWESQFTIYPNPSAGIFRLKSVQDMEAEAFEVFLTDGRKLQGVIIQTDPKEIQIHLDAFPAGIYFLRHRHWGTGILIRE